MGFYKPTDYCNDRGPQDCLEVIETTPFSVDFTADSCMVGASEEARKNEEVQAPLQQQLKFTVRFYNFRQVSFSSARSTQGCVTASN
jgi:hypothetical protein